VLQTAKTVIVGVAGQQGGVDGDKLHLKKAMREARSRLTSFDENEKGRGFVKVSYGLHG